MEIKTPEHLVTLLKSFELDSKARFELNRKLANHTRKAFRSQIRAQRDINDKAYAPRNRANEVRVTRSILRKQAKGYSKKTRKRTSSKSRTNYELDAFEINTRITRNNNMFTGLSNDLKTQISSKDFSVGLSGMSGHIARKHNEGKTISFTTRLNGWFNSKTRKWEGGREVKNYYQMPKRTMIGWTPELERELVQIIFKEMQSK